MKKQIISSLLVVVGTHFSSSTHAQTAEASAPPSSTTSVVDAEKNADASASAVSDSGDATTVSPSATENIPLSESKNEANEPVPVLDETPTTPPRSELFLYANSKQVKLLYQTLEYKVLDGDSIQVGNLLISRNTMKLTKKDAHSITFEGPLQFMPGATIMLKDPHGKALWSYKIKDINELERKPAASSAPNAPRSESGFYHLNDIRAIEEKLAQNSYFSYCLYSENKANRVQVCSPNYSLSRKEQEWQITMLPSSRKENSLFVNGSEVNETGIIQFDKNIKTASLAALLTSGLSVELRTDSIPLELMNLDYDEKSATINLIAREKSKTKKQLNHWPVTLNVNDPYLFVEGYGQVPLRQVVSINKADLPSPADRPTLLNNPHRTYSSSITVRIQEKDKMTINSKTEGDTVELKSPEFHWTLNQLKPGYNRAHLIEINSNKKKFLGGFEVERGKGLDLGLNLGLGSFTRKVDATTGTASESLIGADISVQKYFDSLFGLMSPAHYLRWGTSFSAGTRKLSDSKNTLTSIDLSLIYRLASGFYFIDPSTSIQLSLRGTSVSGQAEASQWLGVKIAHDGPIKDWTFLGYFHSSQIGVYPVCLNDGCKDTSLINASWQSRYKMAKNSYWSWKGLVEVTQGKTNGVSVSTTRPELQLGAGFEF